MSFLIFGEENGMEVSLVIVKADGTTRDFPLSAQRTVIGRQNTCGLRIPLHSVSRKHCEVQMLDGQLLVRDLGSSNGTQINDQKVKGQAKLLAGDRLQLGPVIFTVVIDGKPEVVDPSATLITQAHAVETETRGGVAAAPQTASAKSGSRHVLSTSDREAPAKELPDHSDLYDLGADPANSGVNAAQGSKGGSAADERAAAAESALADLDALLAAPLDVDGDDEEVLEILDADDDPMADLQAKAEGKDPSSKTAIDNPHADASAETAEVLMDDEDEDDDDLDIDDPLASLEALTDDILDDDDDDILKLDDSDLK
jgi:pSer/pThr/pTyr-binding forkhead associated (FHA) protein